MKIYTNDNGDEIRKIIFEEDRKKRIKNDIIAAIIIISCITGLILLV